MKRIFLALALYALLLPSARQAIAADVSIDFFYDNLGDDGSWVDAGDYGYCWQPGVAVNNSSWRPYSDGYWAYTDVGWTWISYENFGWATYHYGRWARLDDYGWVWVPGTEWGPAWVSWRTGGDYVGWAPLPPRHSGGGGEVVYEGRPIGTRVDIDFDIGPDYYNFVDVRYIGEPILRERIYEPSRNTVFVTQTVNVTNITYRNNAFHNYGPDYNRLSAYSTRPIQRLRLERSTNIDSTVALQSGALTRVQGDRLMVGAPQRLTRPAQRTAPKFVKTKLEKANLESGWRGVSDPQAKEKLQAKFRTEDSKAVPPPLLPPTNPAALTEKKDASDSTAEAAAASAAPPAIPAPTTAPQLSAKEQKKRDRVAKALGAAPTASPGAAPNATPFRGRGVDKRAALDQTSPPKGTPQASPAASSAGDPPELNSNSGVPVGGAANSPGRGRSGKAPKAVTSPTAPVLQTDVPAANTNPASQKLPNAQAEERKNAKRDAIARQLNAGPGAVPKQSAPVDASRGNPAAAAAQENRGKGKGKGQKPAKETKPEDQTPQPQ